MTKPISSSAWQRITEQPRSASLIVLSDDQLHSLIQETVVFTLTQIREKPPGKQRLTPSEVRKMARCSAQKISDALNSGKLPAIKEETGVTRVGKTGASIPGFRYWIDSKDAEAFVQSISNHSVSKDSS